ncbi:MULTISPECIES: phosphatase PAP2 family protein [Gordonia]|uniref:Phosphatidic acid phosphatase type 2/haloperoxidase domain-containing protein n=2 Tax=Gordonia TaxID=2053 RepID=L7LPX9_9ACTN|nr:MULTISPECIES: phosphatase PAP2 family protein [Gordonia]AUH69430.1 phosphatase PAP2 family protein [Gordonia sp. YC-JH1]MBY4570603.1 hypothetical protein [Gordonia sihwensis]WFN94115.1 phosphatase PAP2 family protein [Gordonia sihwensis]GAC62811.1 hypothetical protein GSI01S_44_00240 [Gordonia sihwensis NBRC 108236]
MTHRTSPIAALAAAILASLGIAATYELLVVSYAGQMVDQDVMELMGARTGNDAPTGGLLAEIQVPVLAGCGLLIGAICLARRSWRLALHASLLIGAVVVLAVVLKSELQRPPLDVGNALNSFPSNTVAAFAAAGIALCAVTPRRARPLAAIAATAGLGVVSFTVVSQQWHRPSDVIGGALLAVAVAAVVDLLIPAWNARPARAHTEHDVRDWQRSRAAVR